MEPAHIIIRMGLFKTSISWTASGGVVTISTGSGLTATITSVNTFTLNALSDRVIITGLTGRRYLIQAGPYLDTLWRKSKCAGHGIQALVRRALAGCNNFHHIFKENKIYSLPSHKMASIKPVEETGICPNRITIFLMSAGILLVARG